MQKQKLRGTISIIGTVIPAHEQAIRCCFVAVQRAAQHPALMGKPVEALVVLEDCTDAPCAVATASGTATLSVRARNVGKARNVCAQALLARGARWHAFTDADTVLSEARLANQPALQADVVCGTVCVQDWSPHGAAEVKAHFGETYFERDGHRHVHGANLGVSAEAYREVGGSRQLACGADEALVAALLAARQQVAWSSLPNVVTSACVNARTPAGCSGARSNAVAQRLAGVAAPLHNAATAA
ncbi:glycosyltransferase family 2 protein [Variovorax sp. OK605]|jgi:hypothetical protein|uniref:glycosyltransferase family 2 protein n=1 Tax=Variovorax sp. OK605 TaxID=1855317 RepID=UPI00210D3D2A|nr:glycosyltransferase family 2 protein [Variovorax sp. OK605]